MTYSKKNYSIIKKYSIGEVELLALVWGLEKFRFYLYGKNGLLYTDHQALEILIRRDRYIDNTAQDKPDG